MMINRLVSTSVVLAVLLSCAAVPASADRDHRDDGQRGQRDQPRGANVHRNPAPSPPPRGYVLDNRYHHDRYYPPRNHVVPVLPPRYHVVPYRGSKYYYHGGVWYRPSGTRFVVVLPPVGLFVPFLPPFYTTIWVGGVPYYYADGVYYAWRPEDRTYVVTEPPPESEVNEQPATPDQLFIYPQKGQSEQQQATDRYQCHSWSVDQTGFDPTKTGGNVSEAQYPDKRSDYQRAMKACLEARGYSVQ